MNRTLANIISYIFHPIFYPLVGMYIAVKMAQQSSFLSAKIDMTPFFTLIGINTIIIPILTLIVFKRMGLISDYNIGDRKERTLPFIVSLFYLGVTYYLLSIKFSVPFILALLLGIIVSLVLVAFITPKFKISVHMAGVSGFFGGILALSQLFQINTNYYLMGLALAIGYVASARLYLKAHTPWQVITGTVLGFFVVYFITRYELIITF